MGHEVAQDMDMLKEPNMVLQGLEQFHWEERLKEQPGGFPLPLTHPTCSNTCVRQFSPNPAINKVLDQTVRLTQIQSIKWCLIKVHRVLLLEVFPLFSFLLNQLSQTPLSYTLYMGLYNTRN